MLEHTRHIDLSFSKSKCWTAIDDSFFFGIQNIFAEMKNQCAFSTGSFVICFLLSTIRIHTYMSYINSAYCMIFFSFFILCIHMEHFPSSSSSLHGIPNKFHNDEVIIWHASYYYTVMKYYLLYDVHIRVYTHKGRERESDQLFNM